VQYLVLFAYELGGDCEVLVLIVLGDLFLAVNRLYTLKCLARF
jgi:hypothetical protein